jgi:protein-disulfide isomerase
MDKRFLAILGVIAAVFIGIFIFSQSGKDSGGNNGGSNSQQATNHVKGENAKNVTLLEYGDFQCPVCGLYEPTVQQVYAKYQKDIQFQFRNLPLVSLHPNAFGAARAAEAAGMQNKYWEMHDKLYQNQIAWSSSNNALSLFKNYAQEINLDVNKFTADYAKKEVNDAINADIAAFGKTGQEQATPTFFINGKYVANSDLSDEKGMPSVDKFSQKIEAAFNSSGQ